MVLTGGVRRTRIERSTCALLYSVHLIGGSWTYFQPKHTLTARGTRPRDKLHWFSHLQDLTSLIPVTSELGI
jgi:hypothetical protein